jgi:hypothetical protein
VAIVTHFVTQSLSERRTETMRRSAPLGRDDAHR